MAKTSTMNVSTRAVQSPSSDLVDRLTGLGTRSKLLADLGDALEPGAPPQILALFDLGGHADYLEAYGRIESERLLVRVADTLGEALGSEARCYRPRYDEFAVLVDAGSAQTATLEVAVGQVNATLDGHGVVLAYGAINLPFEANEAGVALALADARLFLRAAGRRARERRSEDRVVSAPRPPWDAPAA
jgi:GGDEF domain-containing protein